MIVSLNDNRQKGNDKVETIISSTIRGCNYVIISGIILGHVIM